MLPLTVTIDGAASTPDLVEPRLVRAVLISLFTWRRANPDDVLPDKSKQGWWGDIYADPAGDKIGSRLWLLTRAKFTPDIPAKAKEYAEESLAWLTEDGVAESVTVEAERQWLDRLALGVRIVRGAAVLNMRFDDVWAYLR